MTVGVVLLTYAPSLESPRHEYAVRTARALAEQLCPTLDVLWHVADDGSPDDHVVSLLKEFMAWNEPTRVSTSNAARRGYGASYNLATQALHEQCEYLLMVEDDWELTRPLDLGPLVEALQAGLGCIRLGYLGWTQELRGKIAAYAGQTFLELDPESPEPHVWSGHPRLETREFQRAVGPWPEGLDPGTTEFVVAHRAEARHGVAWPLDLGVRAGQVHGTLFAHIGAIQAREDQ